jgi:hypothetical protein
MSNQSSDPWAITKNHLSNYIRKTMVTYDSGLRSAALEFAVRTQRHDDTPETIVERAEAFRQFLVAGDK